MPTPAEPLFQAAAANLNPWTEDKVDTRNPERGRLLILDGELDHTVPWAIANASYKQQRRNPGVTEIQKVPGRGHALTIDSGWREIAQISLAFVKRFVPGQETIAVPIEDDTSEAQASRTGTPESAQTPK